MAQKINDEAYELRPAADLKTGDYAIVMIANGVPAQIYNFHVESSLPPYPQVSQDVVLAEFNPSGTSSGAEGAAKTFTPIIRWYFDSDPRGARIFWRMSSNTPNQVKNTNESYLTTTPLEETRALNIPGLTYRNSSDVVIEVKLTKRGYEDQVKRYNVRQALDQQEISGFFEMVQKDELFLPQKRFSDVPEPEFGTSLCFYRGGGAEKVLPLRNRDNTRKWEKSSTAGAPGAPSIYSS